MGRAIGQELTVRYRLVRAVCSQFRARFDRLPGEAPTNSAVVRHVRAARRSSRGEHMI